MNKILIIIFSFLFPMSSFAQIGMPATDPGLLGQFKRMVSDRWDDWKPDPAWHHVLYPPFWVPRNAEGAAFWGVVNRKYWKGADQRPMRVGGPFDSHLLSARLQQQMAGKEKDSVTVTMKKSLATDASMEGGDLDVPYNLYFNDKFNRLFSEADTALQNIQHQYPEEWQKLMHDPTGKTKQLIEYFEVTKDRIHTLHTSYMDRGARMIAYFKILKTLEEKVDFTRTWCNETIREARLPTPKQIRKIKGQGYIPANDQEAVRHILKNWDF